MDSAYSPPPNRIWIRSGWKPNYRKALNRAKGSRDVRQPMAGRNGELKSSPWPFARSSNLLSPGHPRLEAGGRGLNSKGQTLNNHEIQLPASQTKPLADLARMLGVGDVISEAPTKAFDLEREFERENERLQPFADRPEVLTELLARCIVCLRKLGMDI